MGNFKRNNELVEKVESIISQNENISLEEKKELNQLLSSYKSATYKEWEDRDAFDQMSVSDMVNNMSFDDDAMAQKMAHEHPTLQQNFMRLCLKFIKAEANVSYYDGRNESSVKIAKEICSAISSDYLPYI